MQGAQRNQQQRDRYPNTGENPETRESSEITREETNQTEDEEMEVTKQKSSEKEVVPIPVIRHGRMPLHSTLSLVGNVTHDNFHKLGVK